jgi:hypothetical protein
MPVLQPMLGPEHDGVNLFAQFSPFVAGGKTLTDNSTAVGCSEKFLGWLALPMKMLSDHVPQIVMSAQVAHNRLSDIIGTNIAHVPYFLRHVINWIML